jgi:hypothetical protein
LGRWWLRRERRFAVYRLPVRRRRLGFAEPLTGVSIRDIRQPFEELVELLVAHRLLVRALGPGRAGPDSRDRGRQRDKTAPANQ